MTPTRSVDTQRLSIVAHEHEKQLVQFYGELKDGRETANVLTRIGTGRFLVMMEAHGDPAALAAMTYAGKLIDDLGMYDDFTLWVAGSADGNVHANCVLSGEPTNLCIRRRENDGLKDSHPLVQAAVDTYETLFELPPVITQSSSAIGPKGVPSIAFGPGEDGGHLLQAAQFYAAFPMMFAATMKRR
jgi:hypothetical protein